MIIACDKNICVRSPKDVAPILQKWLATVDIIDKDKEHFIAIHLNSRNKIKRIEVVSIGVVNAVLIHPREVYKRAIRESSSQLIIAHNHPSGECTPSDEDISITRRLEETGTVLGIELIDHIIFSRHGFYSIRDHGLI